MHIIFSNRLILLVAFLCSFSIFTNLSAKEIKIKFATLAPEGTPWADTLNNIKARVEKESNKEITISVFLGGQLGGELEIAQLIRRGNIQGAGLTMGALGTIIPEVDVLEFPFLFSSNEEADFILDEYVYPFLMKECEKKQIFLVSLAENGWRGIGHKTKMMKKLADFKGEKFRSQESKVHLDFWKTLEASPTAISIPEVLSSLQTGIVNGFDNTLLFTLAAEWHTQIKYYSYMKHIYQPAVVIYSLKFWKGLSTQQQKILLGQGNQLAPEIRKSVRQLETELIDVMKKSKVEVYEPSASERATLINIFSKKHEAMAKKMGPNALKLYKLVVEGKNKFKLKK